ncbi:MAG: divergent polysaccharide deacetylase family protein [Alphaproteobacteria bacterium]
MKSSFRSSAHLRFTLIALIMMVFIKVFMIDGIDSYKLQDSQPESTYEEILSAADDNKRAFSSKNTINKNYPEKAEPPPSFDFSSLMPQPESIPNKKQTLLKPKIVQPEKINPPHIAIPKPQWDGKTRAKIAIIIDDMGVSRNYTQEVVDLPAPLTLAFLPYAERLETFTKPSMQKGHELIIHVPMEPMNPDLDLGPAGLTTDLDREAFLQRLDEDIFSSFEGYVGINNHMGSKLTQDEEAMNWLMPVLKERDLLFVDSKTIHTSVAAKTAHQYGVEYAERDVFLDHYDTLESVIAALDQLEKTAKRNGQAIAIGHPKKNTIEALKLWMPSIKERGLELVPVSALVQKFEDEKKHATLPLKNTVSYFEDIEFLPIGSRNAFLRHSLPPG